VEGTGELEEEHYNDRWLHSFSNKPDTDEDAWHGADFEIIPGRVLLPGSPSACSPFSPVGLALYPSSKH